MPILSADALEQRVIHAIFSDIAQRDGERLQDEIAGAIERHRVALLEALRLLEEQLPILAEQREEALVAVINQTLPATLKKAIVERADRLVTAYQENEAQQQQIRAAIESLTAKARSVLAVLTDPNLDPSRWQEPAVFAAFRRALVLLVKKAVVDRKLKYLEARITLLAQNTVQLEEGKADSMLKLMEKMEDNDDVQNVYANFDIADDVMEKLSQ